MTSLALVNQKLVARCGAALCLPMAYGAYRLLGWIGVGLLGLLIAFVAVQADMDAAAPIGTAQNTGLYASTVEAQDRLGQDKDSRRAETRATRQALLPFKVIGAALSLLGLVGFFWLQLPH